MALAPGTKLGQYDIIAPLGAGGMGEVYRARDPQLGREVAIKVLPASLSRDPDRMRRFEQEARAAAALNHPNILAVYQMGTYEGAPYLVSELLEGGTLREQLLRGPLPLRKAVEYGAEAARGLAAAHEKGIVHRDLKPENVFVTKDGRIKILDFGLAKLTQVSARDAQLGTPTMTSTEPGVVMGTVGYMSPEQVRGETADHRTDLFSLGLILYEMLTGKRAFHKPTSAETMSAILNEDPPAVSQIVSAMPPALQRVVQRCLEKNPVQRFQSASDLAFALEALSDSGSAPSAAVAAVKQRTSWGWIAAIGAALVIAVALALWFTRPQAVPVVESVAQLTNDGLSKDGNLVTDGARVYFNEGPSGSLSVAQVSVHGGQTGSVQTNLVNAQIDGLTADGAALLVLTAPPTPTHFTMWSLPLPAGEPRRLGDTDVRDASLFPDGHLIYLLGSAVYVAEKDGSSPRKLDGISKYIAAEHVSLNGAPSISPDGKRLAGGSFDDHSQSNILFEGAVDGTNVHTIVKGGTGGLPVTLCCAQWTMDGKHLIFLGKTEGRWDLWALSEEKWLLGGPVAPVRLTNGPLSYTAFAAALEDKQIFVVGAQRRGELVHYDAKAHEFVPYLGGISAYDPTFSRDEKWVSYVSYPEHTLWRSRADGSDRMQLTYPPLIVTFPRISPDGERVSFSTRDGVAYVVNMNGGTPRKVADNSNAPDWSPDGNLLAVTSSVSGTDSSAFVFQSGIVDLRSGNISVVPDSHGTIGPWFATQDTLIAVSHDQSRLSIFDLRTRKWTDVATNPDKFVNWEASADGKYFLYSTGGNNPGIFRMRLADHAVEEVARLKNFHGVDDPYTSTGLSVGADNSPVLTRDVGTQEIYALTVKWP